MSSDLIPYLDIFVHTGTVRFKEIRKTFFFRIFFIYHIV